MNRRTTLLTCALVLGAAAAGLVATVGQAKAPAKNGLIAFSRYRFIDRPLREEIWVANPDGSGQRQLTHAGPNYLDSDPDWAPDGSRLVFGRCTPGGRCTVWSVKADGSGPRMLSRDCGRFGPNCPEDHGASYSPDGHALAFVRFTVTGTGTIMISDANLQHARPVFSFGRDKGAPAVNPPFWSPDGKRLVFSLCNCNGSRNKPVNGLAVFVINTDGSGLRRLTPWSLKAGTAGNEGGSDRIDWSPDGSRILFRTVDVESEDPGPSTGNLYTIRPDGSDVRRITHLPPGTGVQLGSYSPDGRSIVFTSTAGATPKPGDGGSWPDVFVINADGTGLTKVTSTKNWEGTPSWGPRR